MYALMKSELSAIWSSVIPICRSSSKRPFQDGSLVSKGKSLLRDGAADGGAGGGATWIEGAGIPAGAGGGAVAPEDDRPSKLPKIERPTPPLPFVTGAGPCPRVEAKGVALVSLLAPFSRS